MKKSMKISLSALLLSAVAVACQSENDADLGCKNQDNTFAIRANVADTRAGFNDLEFVWKGGDELRVKTDNETLTLSLSADSSDGNVGQFEGTPTAPLAGYAYVAYHSAINQIQFTGNSVDFAQPTEQIQKNGHRTEGTNYCYSTSLGEYSYMYGKSRSEVSGTDTALDVNMQHVMTIIDFTLSNLPLNKELHYLTLTPSYALNSTATVDIENSTVEYTNPFVDNVKVKLQTSNDAGFVAQSTDRDLIVRMALLPHEIPADATWTISLSTSAVEADVVDAEYSVEKSFAAPISLEAGVRNGALVDYDEMTLVDNTPDANDYVDEYGINHGAGVEINGVIWAPVNCGYHATDNKYGKLYQWGRIYGGGWSNGANDTAHGNDANSTLQAKTATAAKISAATANDLANASIYYTTTNANTGWEQDATADLWSSQYNPCPEGWSVPEYSATEMRMFEKAVMTSDYIDKVYTTPTIGALYTDADSGAEVFLPAAGYRNYGGTFNDKGKRALSAWYWTSKSNGDTERGIYMKLINAGAAVTTGWGQNTSKGAAMPIRCVKQAAQ